jgi:hypothetical protein
VAGTPLKIVTNAITIPTPQSIAVNVTASMSVLAGREVGEVGKAESGDQVEVGVEARADSGISVSLRVTNIR